MLIWNQILFYLNFNFLSVTLSMSSKNFVLSVRQKAKVIEELIGVVPLSGVEIK